MAIEKKFLLKFILDKIIASLLLFIFTPFICLIFFAIWLEGIFFKEDKGPALYKETRISKGRPFRLFKFRVIKVPAIEKMKESDSATFLQLDKKNVTRAGRVLIKFYLDELPQIFNVLIGDVSFVGPRPRIPFVYQNDLKDGYTALKLLKAGITGPHQISKGTRQLSLARSEEYCVKCGAYSPSELLMYDLGIMLKTFIKILKAEGL